MIELRGAHVEDVDAILAFWDHAAEGRSVSDDVAGVRALLERDADALFIAEDDGAIVGTVIAGWDGWRCHIYRLAVASDRRREGIARALVEAAEARFLTMGGRRADAMVLDSNEDAHFAWRKLGYEREGHWSRWVKPLR